MYSTILGLIKQQIYIDYGLFIPNEIVDIIRTYCLDCCLPIAVQTDLKHFFSNCLNITAIELKNLKESRYYAEYYDDGKVKNFIHFNIICSIYDIKHLDHYSYYTNYVSHITGISRACFNFCWFIECHFKCKKSIIDMTNIDSYALLYNIGIQNKNLEILGINPYGFFKSYNCLK